MLIIASALAFGHWMTELGIPGQLVQFTVEHGFSIWQFLLAMNVLLLVTGCFLEVIATLLVVMPDLDAGAETARGRSCAFLHHFHAQHGDRPGASAGGAEFVCALLDLRRADRRSGAGDIAVPDLLLTVLMIITYVPVITLWLPGVVFGR